MTFRVRLLTAGVVALMVTAAFFLGRPTSSAVLYTGLASAGSGPLDLEVRIDPPVGRPGEALRLSAQISNSGAQSLSPSIILRLPRGLSANVFDLPTGATFNLQENRIDWLPSVPAGASVDFALELLVETADVLAPEQDVSATLRHQGTEVETAARLWLGIPPIVGNMLDQNAVAVGQPIKLHAEVAGPGPMKVLWSLSDGREIDVAEPVVVYPVAGEQVVTIIASNPGGQTSHRTTLTVLPNPVASFRPDDESPAVAQPVTFVNASGGQPPLTVSWDFGDGATVTGEQQPAHAYQRAGTYRVRLLVENEFGRSEALWDVSVGVAPVADMIIPDRTTVGQTLLGQAFGDDSTRFLWDMGDGHTAEGRDLSYKYRLPGDYFVRLIADNGFGQAELGRWVHVEAGITTLFLPLAAFQTESYTGLSAEAPPSVDLSPVISSLDGAFSLDPIPFPAGTSPAEQLYAYLNTARASFDLAPLAYSYELSGAAQSHARDKATYPAEPHLGSDGTTAAERLLRAGYRGGYAGEATAWGFADPRLAVEFWMNSDSHRPLLLNRLATELGVGYVEDFGTANIWHWTAEFGISYGAPAKAQLRSQVPEAGSLTLDTEPVNYSWLWPLPLAAGERFSIYLAAGDRQVAIGSISEPVYGSRYVLSADALSALGPVPTSGPVSYEWLVRLEDSRGRS